MATKRSADVSDEAGPVKNHDHPEPMDIDNDPELEFNDDFEDDFESEDEIMEAGVDGRPDAELEAEQAAMNVDEETFIVGRHKLGEGETLSPDLTAYDMLQALESQWPALSCHILRDQLGNDRKTYPATVYAVAGTQAAKNREKENAIMIMKMSGLSKQERDDESGNEDDEENEDEDSDPILETKSIPVGSCTNRIRSFQTPQASSAKAPVTFTASSHENGLVLIHDISQHIASFDVPGTVITPTQNKPVCTIRAHGKNEGYALDWSPNTLNPEGRLVSGDCRGNIFSTVRTQGGGWVTDTTPFTGHKGSVEALRWSPSEKHVFASGGDDGCVKIYDSRSKSRKAALSVQVSNTDVNAIAWNPISTHLLASGHDDGSFHVYDLRQWKPSTSQVPSKPEPVAAFSFHKEQITSLEFHPTDDSIILACAGDNTLSIWDLAVEVDDEESNFTAGVKDVPSQLLFVHYQSQVKEAHWHPQINGAIVSTGGEGFNVFKTISV